VRDCSHHTLRSSLDGGGRADGDSLGDNVANGGLGLLLGLLLLGLLGSGGFLLLGLLNGLLGGGSLLLDLGGSGGLLLLLVALDGLAGVAEQTTKLGLLLLLALGGLTLRVGGSLLLLLGTEVAEERSAALLLGVGSSSRLSLLLLGLLLGLLNGLFLGLLLGNLLNGLVLGGLVLSRLVSGSGSLSLGLVLGRRDGGNLSLLLLGGRALDLLEERTEDGSALGSLGLGGLSLGLFLGGLLLGLLLGLLFLLLLLSRLNLGGLCAIG
jgi:hypothetical protein